MSDEYDEEYEHKRRPGNRYGHGHGHWMRHTALVPKGFLRYQLLKMLGEKPMSGSEIMSDMEGETNGYWKPSPGSIYPLLAWLQDKGFIKEAEQKEAGIRRYTLTEPGKAFLQQESKSQEEMDKRLDHFGPMWYGFGREGSRELRKVEKNLFRAVKDLCHESERGECSKEVLEETKKALEQITKEIQDITKKLQE
jgi:DNA-binding PadR family transcriptional regulator